MKIEYKRDLQKNYMILEALEEAEEDGYCLRMAEQNEIQGILPFFSGKRDGRLYLHYEITSKQSVEHLYSRNLLNCHDILFLLNGISNTMDELQKYLLSPAQILFEPQFIFMYPDKSRLFLCYLPGENTSSIRELAEFILKRLNHEDARAVALGYQFYQKSLEENFSLQKTLKEILYSFEQLPHETGKREEARKELTNGDYEADELQEKTEWEQEKPKCSVKTSDTGNRRKFQKTEIEDFTENYENQEEKKEEKHRQAVSWLFERVHPLVFFSALCLFSAVAVTFFLGWLRLTEAGGIFFLILSAEILSNKFWMARREKKKQNWWGEDPEEEYSRLQKDVYQEKNEYKEYEKESVYRSETVYNRGAVYGEEQSRNIQEEENWRRSPVKKQDGYLKRYQETENRKTENRKIEDWQNENWQNERERESYIEETRCLVPEAEEDGLRLVCLGVGPEKGQQWEEGMYPDILIGKEELYVGKMRGESDILLDSPTVSRIHARLNRMEGKYYVKDLNSKNGTFVNGERLQPQEQFEIQAGDRIGFAEILYHVI